MKKVTLLIRANSALGLADRFVTLCIAPLNTVTADLRLQENAEPLGWSGEELIDISYIVGGLAAAIATSNDLNPKTWLQESAALADLDCVTQIEQICSTNPQFDLAFQDPEWHRKLADFCQHSFSTILMD